MITNPAIEKYIDLHKTAADAHLMDLERTTHLKALSPQMLSGQTQGNFLAIISLMIKPRRILEIGTYTGFSALCMAEGLAEDGMLHTIDMNLEIEPIARTYFERSPVGQKITFHLGDAKQIIKDLNETWDLVFIDADKDAYATYYDLVIDHLRPGGLIMADNVLWYGKVLNENMDKKTAAIHAFNQKLATDPRVKSMILPLRDGIHLAVKL